MGGGGGAVTVCARAVTLLVDWQVEDCMRFTSCLFAKSCQFLFVWFVSVQMRNILDIVVCKSQLYVFETISTTS